MTERDDELERLADVASMCMLLAADAFRNRQLGRDGVAIECSKKLLYWSKLLFGYLTERE